jgi:ABC-type sugar transport system permease subunit
LLRVLPHRWWVLLAGALIGAACGFLLPLVEAQRMYSRSGESVWPAVDDLAQGAVIGAVVGIAAALLLLLAWASRDTPFMAARRASPNAEVVQAHTVGAAVAGLVSAKAATLPAHVRAQTWSPIVFDRQGMHIWAGGVDAAEVMLVEWSSISAVELGERGGVGTGRYKDLVDRLAVSVLVDGQLAVLQFGVEHHPRVFSMQVYSTAHEISLLAQRINDLRDGIVRVRPGEQRARLISGPTAWNASQVSLLFTVLAGITGTLLIAASLLLGYNVSVEAALWALTPILPIAAVAAIAALVCRRVVARELAAGYTTLNGRHLEREQRHPRFGHVIRQAGHPALDQRDFFALLRSGE